MYHTLDIDPRIRGKRDELLAPPILVRLTGEIDEAMVDHLASEMGKAHETGQSVLPVVIDSFGGSAYSLLGLIEQLRQSRLPVATVVESKAMSAGAILFGFGGKGLRFMAPEATLMLHDCWTVTAGKAQEVQADAEETCRLNRHIYRLLAVQVGRPPDYFIDLIHRRSHTEWYLTAPQARRHRLATHIGVPSYRVAVRVEDEFRVEE